MMIKPIDKFIEDQLRCHKFAVAYVRDMWEQLEEPDNNWRKVEPVLRKLHTATQPGSRVSLMYELKELLDQIFGDAPDTCTCERRDETPPNRCLPGFGCLAKKGGDADAEESVRTETPTEVTQPPEVRPGGCPKCGEATQARPEGSRRYGPRQKTPLKDAEVGPGGWQEARERLDTQRKSLVGFGSKQLEADIEAMLDEVDRLNKQLICEVCACNRPPYGVAAVCSDHYGQIVKDHDEHEDRIEALEVALRHYEDLLTADARKTKRYKLIQKYLAGGVGAKDVAASGERCEPLRSTGDTPPNPTCPTCGRITVSWVGNPEALWCGSCGKFAKGGRTPPIPTVACVWKESDPWGDMPQTYDTDCGECWSFVDGGVEDNRVKFCHGCGKPVAVEPFKRDDNDNPTT